jgi:hypothetical protein
MSLWEWWTAWQGQPVEREGGPQLTVTVEGDLQTLRAMRQLVIDDVLSHRPSEDFGHGVTRLDTRITP